MVKIREANSCNVLYPCSVDELNKLIEIFNEVIEESYQMLKLRPRAIISPHFEYMYSGFLANYAHRVLANSKPKRVVVIGPSHHLDFEGISVSNFEKYQTPYGTLNIDLDYISIMASEFELKFNMGAHQIEYSTETQMPFIAKYYQAEVIELIYGNVEYQELADIIKWLLEDELTSIVITSNLSHYYDLDKAIFFDNICLKGIENLDNKILDVGCEACGLYGIKGLLEASRELGLKSKILDYSTTADMNEDTSKVIGYTSAVIY
jgi:AmmeMemoRadiSam system protein B